MTRADRILTATFAEPVFGEARQIARPQAIVTEAFDVWQTQGAGVVEYEPRYLGDAPSFADAVRLGEMNCGHRTVFFVRRIDLRPARPVNAADNRPGQVLHHYFEIKKSTKAFVYRDAYDGGRPVKLGQLYSQEMFTVRVNGALASLSPERRAVLRETK